MKRSLLFIFVLLVTAQPIPYVAVKAQTSPAASGVVLQVPGVYRFMVGAVRVTALSDGTVTQDLHKLLIGTTAAQTDVALTYAFLRNPVESSINVFLLEIGPRLVLVDTGAGAMFGPGNGGKLIESLAAAGVRPAQINDILLTHVHTDDSGGLVLDKSLAFPNATVHVGKPDVDFFLDRANAFKTGYPEKYFDEAIATLKPYVDAGKVKTFSSTTEVLPGVTASLHPGHTPGTALYKLVSLGQTITFIGDLVHFWAVQFPTPHVTVIYDFKPTQAAGVRSREFPKFVRDRMLIAAPHLPFPGVGHLRKKGNGYEWVPVDYGNRHQN